MELTTRAFGGQRSTLVACVAVGSFTLTVVGSALPHTCIAGAAYGSADHASSEDQSSALPPIQLTASARAVPTLCTTTARAAVQRAVPRPIEELYAGLP